MFQKEESPIVFDYPARICDAKLILISSFLSALDSVHLRSFLLRSVLLQIAFLSALFFAALNLATCQLALSTRLLRCSCMLSIACREPATAVPLCHGRPFLDGLLGSQKASPVSKLTTLHFALCKPLYSEWIPWQGTLGRSSGD